MCIWSKSKAHRYFVDNQAAISIADNPVFNGNRKHFKLKLYFLKEEQKEGEEQLIYCKTESQNADILTRHFLKLDMSCWGKDLEYAAPGSRSIKWHASGAVDLKWLRCQRSAEIRMQVVELKLWIRKNMLQVSTHMLKWSSQNGS